MLELLRYLGVFVFGLWDPMCVCTQSSSGAPQSRGLGLLVWAAQGWTVALITVSAMLTASWVNSYSEILGSLVHLFLQINSRMIFFGGEGIVENVLPHLKIMCYC